MSLLLKLFSNAVDFLKKLLPLFYAGLIVLGGIYLGYELVKIPDQMKVLVLFSLLLFYPAMRYPVVGVYTAFIVLPFIPYFRKLYYLVYQRPSADPLILVGDLIVALSFIGLYFVFRERRDYDFNVRTFSRIMVFYIVYVIVRSVLYNETGSVAGMMRVRFYAPQVLLFFIGIVFAERKKLHTHIGYITVVIGILAALYGIKQLYLGYSEAERIWFSSISFQSLFIGGNARPFSFFQSPASYADYMQISMIALLALAGSHLKINRFWIYLLLPVFGYAILITSVRSNWAGLVLSIFLWTVFLNLKQGKYRYAVIISLVLIFLGFSFWDEVMHAGFNPARLAKNVIGMSSNRDYLNVLITDRMGAVVNPFEEHSMLSRLTLWKDLFVYSLDPFKALLGRGTGVLNADSLYVTYLAEFGYPGLIFISSLVIIFIWKGFRILDSQTDDHTRNLVKAITVFNLTFALLNLTGTHIHAFPGDTFFWFFNGVLIKIASLSKEEKTIEEKVTDNAGFSS